MSRRGNHFQLNPSASEFHPGSWYTDGRSQNQTGRFEHFDQLFSRQQPRPTRPRASVFHGTRVHQPTAASAADDDANDTNFRARLTEQLTREKYECMVCCEVIRIQQSVWTCGLCFHVFHLHCVKRWAQNSCDSEGWRCPGCQNRTNSLPREYRCFCGAHRNPLPWRPGCTFAPHSCGDPCQRKRNDNCVHWCPLICHPGPCDPCAATVTRSCRCGRTKTKVRCQSSAEIKCSFVCGKTLNCKVHECQESCCPGCRPCSVEVVQECFCGKSSRVVPCTAETASEKFFECSDVCDKLFACGLHKCERKCHRGECDTACPWSPDKVQFCPCGKTALSSLGSEPRKSCADSVACCQKTCSKVLGCGPAENPHLCGRQCHEGCCPPCEEATLRTCRCGRSQSEIPCKNLWLYDASSPVLCERRCHKKKSCKRHTCANLCCSDSEHLCTLICGAKLNCGIHFCDLLCHSGKCPTCHVVSFDELRCHCGAEVVYPPVNCGTSPPTCSSPCRRSHPCGHPVTHNCHSEAQCPPCTFLTQKPCYKNHEVRNNIPCYLTDVSCGKACGQALPCGLHNCTRICHPGECASEPFACTQLCQHPRDACDHPCNSLCHGSTPCPETTCKTSMEVRCPCGNRTSRMQCSAVDKFHKRTKTPPTFEQNESANPSLAIKLQRLVCLDCDNECARIQRNRRLAEALDIKDADVSSEPADPLFTDFLKTFYASNQAFVLQVEKDLCALVELAKNSAVPSRSHFFAPMNRDERKFIHEYAHYFVMDTVSYDSEPKRNVVTTAKKNVAQVPSKLLSQTMQKNRVAKILMRPVQLS